MLVMPRNLLLIIRHLVELTEDFMWIIITVFAAGLKIADIGIILQGGDSGKVPGTVWVFTGPEEAGEWGLAV